MSLDNNDKFKRADNDIALSSRDEVKIINTVMTQQAGKYIDIFTHHLDSGVFDNPDFIHALKQLSIASKFTRIRILLQDAEPLIKNGHRIIELIQQMTSSIEVRKIAEEYQTHHEAFNIYDGEAIIYLPHANRYEGFANFHRPRLANELEHFFTEVWERSSPDMNLRRLYI